MKDLEGLGLTKQRQAVLDVIRESEEHLTANDVFENARRLLPGISFATVYNSLRYLKNEGLIAEVHFGTKLLAQHRQMIAEMAELARAEGTPYDAFEEMAVRLATAP